MSSGVAMEFLSRFSFLTFNDIKEIAIVLVEKINRIAGFCRVKYVSDKWIKLKIYPGKYHL